MPSPASLHEQLQRANAALPRDVEIAFRGGPKPYRILDAGLEVARASNLTSAILIANRRCPSGRSRPAPRPSAVTPGGVNERRYG